MAQEHAIQIAMPLSLPCERELIRLYLWPHGSQMDSGSIRDDLSTNAMPSQFTSSASCVDLLPDDPVHRITTTIPRNDPIEKNSPRKMQSNGSKSPHSANHSNDINLQYRYAILRSDYVDSSSSGSGYYFVQFRAKDDAIDLALHPDLLTDSHPQTRRSSATTTTTSSSEMIPPIQNNFIVFEQIIKGYRDGLTKTGVSSSSSSSSKTPAEYDPTLLSSVCRWRSCLSESCRESSTKSLCFYHHHLKKYLDEEYLLQKEKNSSSSGTTSTSPTNVKESSKYLPKKVNISQIMASNVTRGNRSYDLNNQVDRDLLLMTSSCTLIHELWDGKLQQTLTTFSHKICQELNSKKRLEFNLKIFPISLKRLKSIQNFINSPNWSRWRNQKEYQRVCDLIQTNSQLLQRLSHLEKDITQEILLLQKMKIFPSAELIIIKKEMKLFREKYQATGGGGGGGGGGNQENGGGGGVAGAGAGVGGSGAGGGGSNGESDGLNDMEDILLLENEIILAEKKLSIIRGRRVDEEEARIAQKKRIAKAKQIEESQAKDPLNFRNQTRF